MPRGIIIVMELEKIFNRRFYDELNECGFLKDVEDILSQEGMINIDSADFVSLSGGEIVGTISESYNNVNEEIKMKRFKDRIPTNGIVNINMKSNMPLSEISIILDSIRKSCGNTNITIIFGANPNEKLETYFKIQAIFTANRKELSKLETEKDVLYEVALFCLEEKPGINAIQQQFDLGFNRASRIMDKLVDLGIVSDRIPNAGRTMLITDPEKIREKIYN